MEKYELKENQYLPHGLGRHAATYYYFVNQQGQTVDIKTLKPYKGKQMNRYVMKNKSEAQNFLLTINT